MSSKRRSSRNPVLEALTRSPLSPKTLRSPSTLHFLKSVSLFDWWLVQAQDNGIAVEGFAYRELGARLFRSAPILNRHDSTTLKTVDGITIKLSSLIDRSRTMQSGFPVSVCNRFQLGFPYDWEDVTAQLDASDSGGVPALLPTSFDDLSVTKLHDLAMSIPEGSEGDFWDMLVKEHKGDEVHHIKHVPSTKNSEAGNGNVSKGEDGKRDEVNSDMEVGGFVRGGVVTRSMSKRRKQQAEIVIASAGGIKGQ